MYFDLAPGNHQADITGYIHSVLTWKDQTPAIAKWTITNADTTPPDTTFVSGPMEDASVPYTSVTFAYASTEAGSTFECSSYDRWYSWKPCTSPQTWSGLKQGYHIIAIRAKDKANNVDPTPLYRGFTVDTVAPGTLLHSGPAAGSSTKSRSATFSVWIVNGNRLQCKLDAGAWLECQSPKTYSSLALGSHTFQARGRDWAGNVDPTPVVRTWTVIP
jgi:hypothetical protein